MMIKIKPIIRVRNILKAADICLRKVDKHPYNINDEACVQYKDGWQSYYIWYHNIYTIMTMINSHELEYDKSYMVSKVSNPKITYMRGLRKED